MSPWISPMANVRPGILATVARRRAKGKGARSALARSLAARQALCCDHRPVWPPRDAVSGKEMAVKNILLVSLALFAFGCSDPLVGKWEGKDNNDDDFEIKSGENTDYEGDGHLVLLINGSVGRCSFDLEAKETGDNQFEFEVQFKNECSFIGTIDDIECELQNDDTELECDYDGVKVEYEKQGD